MSDRFPIVNLRKDITDQWNLLYINEEITVPTESPYVVRLKEIPDNGEIETAPLISGLSRANTYSPSNGQFSIKYATGDIIFNSAQAGQTFIVDYYGKGTLVTAEEINYLYNTLQDVDIYQSGSVLFANEDGEIGEDNDYLYYDKNEKRFGVNTNFPSETLEVSGTAKFGTGENYTEIETDGTVVARGDATCWDDLRVSANAVSLLGIAAPIFGIIINNNLGGGAGEAISFDGTTQFATLNNYTALESNVDNATLSFWIRPKSINGTIFYRENYLHVRKTNGSDLTISFDNSIAITIPNAFVTNAVHHIVMAFERTGNNTKLVVFENGLQVYNNSISNRYLKTVTTPLYIAALNGTDYMACDMDETQFYNVTLSTAQINQLWNNGNGLSGIPTGITETTQVVFRFPFDATNPELNASTLGAGENLVFTGGDPSVQTSLLTLEGAPAGSIGVAGLIFPPNKITDIFFNVQIPHSYKLGSDIDAHVHWTHSEDGGITNILWGLEYTWCNIGGVIQNTQIITHASPVGVSFKHEMSMLAGPGGVGTGPAEYINGAGKSTSSMLMCRFFRLGTDDADTFFGNAYFMEFDFHFEIDMLGTRQTYAK